MSPMRNCSSSVIGTRKTPGLPFLYARPPIRNTSSIGYGLGRWSRRFALSCILPPVGQHAPQARYSEWYLVLGPQCSGRPDAPLDLRFNRTHEPERAGDVVENQKTLVVVQHGVVVGEASVVPDIVEGLEYRDAGFQDP